MGPELLPDAAAVGARHRVFGTVRALSEGVAAERLDTRVVARTGNEGGYAELVVVDSGEAIDVPRGVDGAVATAVLHDTPLALDRLERATLGPGSPVLVTAAAGSLGQWFMPLAKAAGASVTGAAGGARKTAAVAAQGADTALDYRRDDWALSVGGPFDVVFDGAGGTIGNAALRLTAEGGLFFAHGAAAGSFAATGTERGITVIGVDVPLDDATWRRHTLAGLDLLASGRVRPAIGQRVPLTQAAHAHRAMADRTIIGKSLLTTEQPAQSTR